MRILLVNVGYGIGSTGKIVQSLFDEYKKQGHEVFLIYGRHSIHHKEKNIMKSCYEFESKFWHFLSLFSGNLYGGMPLSTLKINRIIKRINPDIVHLHCLNGFFVNVYSLINFLKQNKYNTVLTNHAEFMYTANCGYSLSCEKWKNELCRRCPRVKEFNGKLSLNRTHHFYKIMERAFKDFNNLTITNVSPWLTDRAKIAPIFKSQQNRNFTVLNPVIGMGSYRPSIENPYKKYNLLTTTKIVLYVTPDINNPEKGGQLINDIANKLNNNDILFFVKSSTKPQFTLGKNIIYIEDQTSTEELYDLYHYANVSLLLSKKETFSMIVAESLCCGTPVVGFKAGGPETITIPKYSSFVENGNINLLATELLKMLNKPIEKGTISKEAKEKYSISKISSQYINIYKAL